MVFVRQAGQSCKNYIKTQILPTDNKHADNGRAETIKPNTLAGTQDIYSQARRVHAARRPGEIGLSGGAVVKTLRVIFKMNT